MIPVSNAFIERMHERTDFHLSAVVTMPNETIILLDDDDFVMSGNRITDSAGGVSLPIGAAICRTAELELVNYDGRWDNVSFVGAEIELSLQYDTSATATPSIETVLLGTFTVKQPATYGATVVLIGSDDMAKAETLYETALSFPQTAFAVWGEVCTTLGFASDYASASDLPGGSFSIATAPSSDLTYRQVLGYIAMLSGGNARVSRARKLEVINYDFAALATARTNETVPDGGNDLELWKELTSDREDIAITGVSTVVSQEDGGFTIVKAGADGNVLNIVNPLIAGSEQAAVTAMWNALSGAQYRPFSGSHVGYPIAEFGDTAYVSDGLGREFWTIITDMTYTVNGFAELGASGDTSESSGSTSLSQKLNLVTADVAEVKRLKVDWADIATAVIQTLQANGINADWINAGAFTVTDENGNILFKADSTNKTVQVGSFYVEHLDGAPAGTYSLGGVGGISSGFQFQAWSYEDTIPHQGIDLPRYRAFLWPDVIEFREYYTDENDVLHYKQRILNYDIGDLSSLTTTAKTSLVAAINEVKEDLTPAISNNTGSTVSVATGTTTNLMSVTLTPGKYLLIGTATFQANSAGYRSLGFAKSASSATEDRFSQATVAAGSGFAPRVQVVTVWNITATTTVYLNAVQDSGSTLSVTAPGIQAIRLQDLS